MDRRQPAQPVRDELTFLLRVLPRRDVERDAEKVDHAALFVLRHAAAAIHPTLTLRTEYPIVLLVILPCFNRVPDAPGDPLTVVWMDHLQITAAPVPRRASSSGTSNIRLKF